MTIVKDVLRFSEGLIIKSKWLLIMAICLFLSCKNSKKPVCKGNTKLSKTYVLDTISISVPDAQYNHDALFYYNNKLYAFDRLNQSIDVFNIEQKVYLTTFHFAHEGPDQINAATQIYVHNDDSIFLANDVNQVFLINGAMKKVNHWNINTRLPDTLSNNIKVYDYTLLAYAKKEVVNLPFTYNNKSKSFLFRFMPAVGSYRNTSNIKKVFELPVLAEVSVASGEVIAFHGQFPARYYASKGFPLDLYPGFTITANNDIIIQYQYNSQLLINKQFVCAKSYYSEGAIKVFETNVDLEDGEEMKGFHQDEAYVSIVNDPYNKLVYRVFQHRQEKRDAQGLMLQKPQSAFSIMAVNYSGDVVGEITLPGSKLDFFNIVPTPKGILISLENSFNYENKENNYEFLLLKNFEDIPD